MSLHENELMSLREYKIVKSNALIRQSRFALSLQQQKIILYLISKIKPEDDCFREYSFRIIEFCDICGIRHDNGKNYRNIKNAIKKLADKSLWMSETSNKEVLLRWINTVKIERNKGIIVISLHRDMMPYLLQLRESFTVYEILYVLAMKSQYAIRLYEILKSYEYKRTIVFEIDALKRQLSAENYLRFPDFKKNVLEIAEKEINEFTDISITVRIGKVGRRYANVVFDINPPRDLSEKMKIWQNIDSLINAH